MSLNRIRNGIICIFLSVILLCLAGCSNPYSASPYLGTWLSTTARLNDTTFSTTELIGQYKLAFEKDGTAVVSYNGEKEAYTWTPTKHGLTMQLENGTEYPVYEEDGRLILQLKSMKFTFEKQETQG